MLVGVLDQFPLPGTRTGAQGLYPLQEHVPGEGPREGAAMARVEAPFSLQNLRQRGTSENFPTTQTNI